MKPRATLIEDDTYLGKHYTLDYLKKERNKIPLSERRFIVWWEYGYFWWEK